MDTLMLDGWTPLLLLMVGMIVVMMLLARILSRKTLYVTTGMIAFICIAMVFVSIFAVGGWEGMGLGVISGLLFVGTMIGALIGRVMHRNVQV